MRAAILQPTYLPWLGYFEMIARTEVLVALDHVQFSRKSWQQRNRIKGPNGEIMLTVPVVSDHGIDVRICDKRVDYAQPWPDKHRKSLEAAYGRAPAFARLMPELRARLMMHHASVADLNLSLIRWLLAELGLTRPILRSSELSLPDPEPVDKSERLIALCKAAGIDLFYEGAAGAAFIARDKFAAAGIRVCFQRYAHPVYPQRFGAFLPSLSVIDLLMNCGAQALPVLLTAGAAPIEAEGAP